ncbi:hypothetical protein ACOBR2_07550 [Telmatobacter bradus]|uniref:hypothetical protein n=1 Tax=Telmatobacter bradus TaxID=474953 RepID=UPI003B429C4C
MKAGKRTGRIGLYLTAVFILGYSAALAAPRHATTATLSANSRALFATAMQWGDQYYDPQTSLCAEPKAPGPLPANPHSLENDGTKFFMVRESSWYAAGLLLRDAAGDRERAAQVLSAVLDQQFHAPGKVWDGTFRRSPNEPDPADHPSRWRGYDPNWRVFIGTTFALILNEYPDRVPAALRTRMVESIDYALQGEMHEGRLEPSYTNIALMYGYLLSYAAEYGGKPEWKSLAEQWQHTVYKLYKQHEAFNEYNSPTYAGVDLYALALWRDYGLTEETRTMGRTMEDGLWRTTAAFYNANLRNIGGPYDRSYGMDMQSYVSVEGLWLRLELNAQSAPLARFDPPVDHSADVWIVPLLVVLDARIPEDALQSFRSFSGEHAVRRLIEGKRVATAWIGKTLIYGGEITGQTRLVDAESQFHPVTAQWLTPTGRIGWLNITRTPPIDAEATKQGIEIATHPGNVTYRIMAPGVRAGDLSAGQWKLAGLDVKLESDAKGFKTEAGDDYVDVTYVGVTKIRMRFTQTLQ